LARSRKVEDELEALGELRRRAPDADATARLRTALAARQSPIAAKAARIAGELEIEALVPDLRAAFERLCVNPVKSDPGCAAKTAIARALYTIGAYEDALFLRGIRHVQREPVWGGSEDTACELRGLCALALIRLGHPDAAVEVAELLADREVEARIGAARAIASSESERFAPLLRFKVLTGDAEPQVVAECVAALLRISAEAALDLCTRLLDGPDAAVAETVALALGESRLRAALPVLRAWWERTTTLELRRVALLAISMLRSEEAHAFLFSLIDAAPGHDARHAIAALAIFREDEALRARIAAAVGAREDVDLQGALAEFEGGRRR